MSKTKTLVFTGAITTRQPISFSPPSSKDSTTKPGHLPRIGESLYLTAAGVRSAVRHAMVRLIDEIRNPQKKMTLDDYFLLTLGGIKDAKKDPKKGNKKGTDKTENDEDVAEISMDGDVDADVSYINRAQFAHLYNPAIALFGSMKHGIPGALFCSHAIASPDAQPDVVRGVRANDFMRDPELASRLDENAVAAFIERQSASARRTSSKLDVKALDSARKAALKAGDAPLAAQLAAEIADAKSGDVTAVQLSLPNLMYECIPPGTELSHEFVLENVSDIEITLFLQSLSQLALMPYLGGKRNHGLGRFAARWEVRARESGCRKMEAIGEVAIDGNFNELVVSEGLSKYMDWDAFVAYLQDDTVCKLSESALMSAVPGLKQAS